jgi:hypothetical protein
MKKMLFFLLHAGVVPTFGMEEIKIPDYFINYGNIDKMQVTKKANEPITFFLFTDAKKLMCASIKNTKNDSGLLDVDSFSVKNDIIFSNATPFSVVIKNAEQSFFSRLMGVYSGAFATSVPYVVREGEKYKVMCGNKDKAQDISFFTHNTPVTHLYGMNINIAVPGDRTGKEEFESEEESDNLYATVISGSAFPSIYMWKQLQGLNITLQEGKVLSGVQEEIKKFPGYYLIAAANNTILYAKHPTKSSLFSRIFDKKPVIQCTVFMKEIIDEEGKLCDLNEEASERVITTTALIPSNGVFQGAVNAGYAAFFDTEKLYIYKVVSKNLRTIPVVYEQDENIMTPPFLVQVKGACYAIWFTKDGNRGCKTWYVNLDDEQEGIKEGKFSENNSYAFTYSEAMNAFHYIDDKKSTKYIRTCSVQDIIFDKSDNDESTSEEQI